ncbi:MAG: YicC family protein [Phycisphaeraceae bacterium]|nr:MAG: YicC family protein [Phycisphaeraceae bacterium]
MSCLIRWTRPIRPRPMRPSCRRSSTSRPPMMMATTSRSSESPRQPAARRGGDAHSAAARHAAPRQRREPRRVIRSMTGFGEASTQVDGAHYFLEVRSLNNKYFKANIRLPDELQGLEPELEAELRRRLTRGTVTLIGKVTDTSEQAAYEINHQALSNYIEQVRQTPQVASGEVRLDLAALLTLPGVLQTPPDEEKRLDRAREVFAGLLDRAAKDLIGMRTREGAALHTELSDQERLIAERLERIALRAPTVVEEYENRLRQRIDSMLQDAGVSIEPVDLIREIAIYAERTDIAEEISRLSAHLAQFRDLIGDTSRGPTGRTLDFLTQEMLREANTIASKSNDAGISRDIVEVKGAIDRIKEQVQNVE